MRWRPNGCGLPAPRTLPPNCSDTSQLHLQMTTPATRTAPTRRQVQPRVRRLPAIPAAELVGTIDTDAIDQNRTGIISTSVNRQLQCIVGRTFEGSLCLVADPVRI
jgi:hypothetical protein